MSDWLREQLVECYGARADDVLMLDTADDPRQVDYLDLLASAGDEEILADAVVESDGRALLYVVQADRLGKDPDAQLRRINHLLACRGDAPYLAVVAPGDLRLYPLSLRSRQSSKGLQKIPVRRRQLPALVPGLATGQIASSATPTFIHTYLFDLLRTATERLQALGLGQDEILPLLGRALFLRFLHDRALPTPPGDFASCLANPDNAHRSSCWLDATFNGDLLPLAGGGGVDYFEALWSRTGGGAFRVLSAIIGLDRPVGDQDYQRQLDWGDIDFAHVPVGLLSQVYEHYIHRFEKPLARLTSVYYTPRHIAEFMVDQAFEGLEPGARGNARVLDPAAGAGVFLVACFRRLVAERWRADGRRPDGDTIREILYRQLAGFDINPAALQLAALGLYLTALEMDGTAPQREALAFQPLQGRVLFDVRDAGESDHAGPVAGSYGDGVGAEHRDAYDLVIGNPPWHTVGGASSPLNLQIQQRIRGIARDRGLEDVARDYQNPDGVPDLVFVWCATTWAKPDGIIALALHGRLLFKQSTPGFRARCALFRGLKVTGILNGAAVAKTRVWPEVDEPFCLLFAQNRVPRPEEGFFFISLEQDSDLNQRGAMRIDHVAAQPVRFSNVLEDRRLFKVMFKGSGLDLDLIRQLDSRNPTCKNYLESLGLFYGQGFFYGSRSKDAGFLKELRVVDVKEAFDQLTIQAARLPHFPAGEKIHNTGTRNIFRPPLTLIWESPKRDNKRHQAIRLYGEAVYTRSFFGFSCHLHDDSERLADYLFIVFSSNLFLYYMLMTGTRFGDVGRKTLLLSDIEAFPIHPFEQLSELQKNQASELTHAIAENRCDWAEIDDWVEDLYGLTRPDRELVADAIHIGLPFDVCRQRAQQAPTDAQVARFCRTLEADLQPFLGSVDDAPLSVAEIHSSIDAPWRFLRLSRSHEDNPVDETLIRAAMATADHHGASRILLERDGDLILGLLRQYRYWTPTRARLCALDLIQSADRHLDRLEKVAG